MCVCVCVCMKVINYLGCSALDGSLHTEDHSLPLCFGSEHAAVHAPYVEFLHASQIKPIN